MTLILLAVPAVIVLAILAYRLAVFALPVMTAIAAFQYVGATGGGFAMAAIAAAGAAVLSMAAIIAVLGFAKNPFLRLAAILVFTVPAAIAGYALVYGIANTVIDSAILLALLCGVGGLVVGIAAMLNLSAWGQAAFSP